MKLDVVMKEQISVLKPPPPTKRNVRRRAWPVRTIFSYILMSILACFFLLPFLFMVVGSLKPTARVLMEGNSWRAFLPLSPTLANYQSAFAHADFLRLFVNSTIVSTLTVIGGMIVNSLFGYGLARFQFRGRMILVTIIIALVIIPLESYAVPLLYMMAQVQWIDTYQVQIVPFIANPFYVYLFYTFFLNLPKELEEVARIDGAGPWMIFVRVMLPLSRPVYATVAILSFLSSWGQLLWPIMVTHSVDVRPLPLGLAFFQSIQPYDWGAIMAFATLMTIPTLIIFLLFQNAFVQSIARSGLKG